MELDMSGGVEVKDKGYCATRSEKRKKRQNARDPRQIERWKENRHKRNRPEQTCIQENGPQQP
jgi:hypothetical protein